MPKSPCCQVLRSFGCSQRDFQNFARLPSSGQKKVLRNKGVDVEISYRVFLCFSTVSMVFPGLRLDFPRKKQENPDFKILISNFWPPGEGFQGFRPQIRLQHAKISMLTSFEVNWLQIKRFPKFCPVAFQWPEESIKK